MTGAGQRNGLVREIWLHICREGGKWTPEEIAARFDLPRQKAALTMHNMAGRCGSLQRFKQGGRAQFGVTKDCKVPQGLSLDELVSIGAIRTTEVA